ncbi:MAG TPA: hypothetical protein VMV10_01940 [Pirellulales bacterium]|nr:hypothetical protein [Pirellulales bacterium]
MTTALEQSPRVAAPATLRQIELLHKVKTGTLPLRIPICDRQGAETGRLAPLTQAHLGDEALVSTFVRWRNQYREGWLDQRPVTIEGTHRWLREVVVDPTRMSFLIYFGAQPIGRCGFLNLSAEENESDGLVRGERGGGADFMHCANVAGLAWQFNALGIFAAYSKVLSSNGFALEGCRRLGYPATPFATREVYRHEDPQGAVLRETGSAEQKLPDTRLLYLRIHEVDFNRALERWRN